MYLYRMHEADLILPEQPDDQTVHIFAYAPKEKTKDPLPEFSLVVNREAVEDSSSISGYVQQQLSILSENLPEFQLKSREEAFIDNAEAVLIEYTWKGDHGLMYQRQAYVLCPSATALRPYTRTALTITGTTRESMNLRHAYTFQQVIQSLHFNR